MTTMDNFVVGCPEDFPNLVSRPNNELLGDICRMNFPMRQYVCPYECTNTTYGVEPFCIVPNSYRLPCHVGE